MKHIIFLHQAN